MSLSCLSFFMLNIYIRLVLLIVFTIAYPFCICSKSCSWYNFSSDMISLQAGSDVLLFAIDFCAIYCLFLALFGYRVDYNLHYLYRWGYVFRRWLYYSHCVYTYYAPLPSSSSSSSSSVVDSESSLLLPS